MSEDASITVPEFRAAGTDLSERRRSGVSKGPVIDLAPDGFGGIDWDTDGGVSIGAFTTIATIAGDERMAKTYPALAATAQGLATPQIRHLATLGGNLAQRSRCWYFRHPHITCLKKGGTDCPARTGNHLHHVAFDLGPCIAPHPSSMAMALLAHDARVVTDRRSGLSIGQLLGDGSSGRTDHALMQGEVIRSIVLPAARPGERGFYKRAISRAYAEWPLVEVCVRADIANGAIRFVRLTAGGIAPVPVRLFVSESVLEGATATPAVIAKAARQASAGANPLPMTGYKLDLLRGLVHDLLERLAG